MYKVKVQPSPNVKVKPLYYSSLTILTSAAQRVICLSRFELNTLVNMKAVSCLRESNYTQDIKPQWVIFKKSFAVNYVYSKLFLW